MCTGWFDHSASQGTWRNTITDVRPQGSGACSTFARSHVQRSHVPRSTFHVRTFHVLRFTFLCNIG